MSEHLHSESDRHERLGRIFLDARDLEGPLRGPFIDRACGDDAALRAEVVQMLTAAAAPGAFLESPALGTEFAIDAVPPEESARSDLVGRQVGRYRILRLIGKGGVALVYLAEQVSPVRRRVAFKVIQAAFASDQVLARFRAEQQVLANLNHPNIAQMYDAGSLSDGRPFLVMEFVEGERLPRHCDVRRFDVPQRLEVFTRICDAIQYAHLQGVIHRDLKPSNILVSAGYDRPVVIDFGVAKALAEPVVDRAFSTRHGLMVGTPGYMSPEQVAGEAIDVRTDIYALGTLLHELLVGVPPFDPAQWRDIGLYELCRRLRESDPPRASHRFGGLDPPVGDEIAGRRGVTRASLSRILRDDLDHIVARSIASDRDRRYQSCGELSDDIRRTQRHEPIRARPPSLAYRVRQAARRRPATVVAATLGAVIAIGALMTTILFVEARREAESTRGDRAEEALSLDRIIGQPGDNVAVDRPDLAVARVANRILRHEASDDDARHFAAAMVHCAVYGSPIQTPDDLEIWFVVGSRHRQSGWDGALFARVRPAASIDTRKWVEFEPLLIPLGRHHEDRIVRLDETSSFGDRLRIPGDYGISVQYHVEILRSAGDGEAMEPLYSSADWGEPVIGLPFYLSVKRDSGRPRRPLSPKGLLADPIDLSDWVEMGARGDGGEGLWIRSADGLVARQFYNDQRSWLLTPKPWTSRRFTATFRVNTYRDHDICGVVWGFQDPVDGEHAFYALEMHTQTKLWRCRGITVDRDSWNVLAHAPMTWRHYHAYRIDLDHDPLGTMAVSVMDLDTGETLWDSGPIRDPDPLPLGRVGFTVGSQADVEFRAWTPWAP